MKRQYKKRVDKQPMCITRGCRRARYNGTVCALHYADQLWASAVKQRDGTCMVNVPARANCMGRLEADHLIPRSYKATRWLLDVGVTLCLAHHKYFTEWPLQHEEFARTILGNKRYVELRRLALSHNAERPEDAIERLRSEVSLQT